MGKGFCRRVSLSSCVRNGYVRIKVHHALKIRDGSLTPFLAELIESHRPAQARQKFGK